MRKAMVLKLTIAVLFVVALVISQRAQGQINQGQQIFRFDTFGDEQLWTPASRTMAASTLLPRWKRPRFGRRR